MDIFLQYQLQTISCFTNEDLCNNSQICISKLDKIKLFRLLKERVAIIKKAFYFQDKGNSKEKTKISPVSYWLY